MTVALNLITHKNVVLIKQIYQRAVIQSGSEHSDVDRILSLISFDLANETLLKNAITAVDSRARIVSDLNELIRIGDDVFARATPAIPLVPDAQKIRRVRKIRNAAMHDATYPTPADVSDCRTYTKDFLQQLVTNVWGVFFDGVSLTDLINNPRVRAFFSQAEQSWTRGDRGETIVNAMAGFQLAMSKAQKAIVGDTPRKFNAVMMADYDEQRPSKQMLESFKKIQNLVFQNLIGLDHFGYIKYKRVTRLISVSIMGDNRLSLNYGRDPNDMDPVDIDFVLHFATESVIKIESLIGDLDDPFGEERWWAEGRD